MLFTNTRSSDSKPTTGSGACLRAADGFVNTLTKGKRQEEESRSMEELTAALQRFSVEVVEASRQVSRDAIVDCMNAVIQPILSAVGKADSRMKCYVPLPTDHYFEAMKVSASDEFELTVVLDSLVNTKTFRDLSETNPNMSCYGQVIFAQSFTSSDMWAVDLCVPIRHGHYSILSATKIRQHFAELVIMIAADIFHNGTVQVSFKDPYTRVKISREDDQHVFRLIPALFFHEAWPACTSGFGLPDKMTSWLTPEVVTCCRHLGYFALPLTCPFSEEESVWRLSFVRAEKYLLRHEGLTTPQGVRKQVERIVKMLRTSDTDAFRPLSSYHLKTVVLHTCQLTSESSDWTSDKLGERLVEVLRRLIVCLEKGSLPHFFIPSCNLLVQFTQQELLATSLRLREIHDELCNNPTYSIRLQC